MQTQLDMFIDFCEAQGNVIYNYYAPRICPLAQFGRFIHGDQPHIEFITGGGADYVVQYKDGSFGEFEVLTTVAQRCALANNNNFADLTRALKELRHDVQ